MKIIIYCQHVLGVGHFFRTLELVKAMQAFEVVLVTGGGTVDVKMPDHVRHVQLPGLMMDENFSALHSVDPSVTVEDVKTQRTAQLLDLVKTTQPDLFLIELYPFGRRAFRFELVPVLEYIQQNTETDCKVVCSLRDILVEKTDAQKYENRVIEALNKWFDAVLIHSDPQLITLDTTFGRIDKINVPLVYTGFVTPRPEPEKVSQIRNQLRNHIRKDSGVSDQGKLIVASVGGGNVGADLLKAVVCAVKPMAAKENIHLRVYTGPYMDQKDVHYLKEFEDDRIRAEEFATDFVSLLGAADLSISMGGYNTCMNIVAAGVPSLVWPFGQNTEQRARVQKLSSFACMRLLEDADLMAKSLGGIIRQHCAKARRNFETALNIDGAGRTAKWIGGMK